MLKFQGIYPSLATPFDHEGNLYKTKVRHNVERWNRAGLSGYAVCGPEGESVHLSFEEKCELFSLVAEAAAPGRLLIAGCVAESVRETVALANRAAASGYQAAMALTPHHDRSLLSRAGSQALYFRAVADQAKIPVILHNRPQATGIDMAAETASQLSEHPNIIAINEDSDEPEKVSRIIRDAKPGFQVLCGGAASLFPSLQAGAVGGILAYASAAPYSAIAIWEAVRTREFDAALDWQNRIARAAALVATQHGVPGLKYAMDLNGYYGGPPRLPLAPPPPEARREIEAAFADLRS